MSLQTQLSKDAASDARVWGIIPEKLDLSVWFHLYSLV